MEKLRETHYCNETLIHVNANAWEIFFSVRNVKIEIRNKETWHDLDFWKESSL